jgi:hypothetical protein
VTFADIEVGKTFYLGNHALRKTGNDTAEGVNFGGDAVVEREVAVA